MSRRQVFLKYLPRALLTVATVGALFLWGSYGYARLRSEAPSAPVESVPVGMFPIVDSGYGLKAGYLVIVLVGGKQQSYQVSPDTRYAACAGWLLQLPDRRVVHPPNEACVTKKPAREKSGTYMVQVITSDDGSPDQLQPVSARVYRIIKPGDRLNLVTGQKVGP